MTLPVAQVPYPNYGTRGKFKLALNFVLAVDIYSSLDANERMYLRDLKIDGFYFNSQLLPYKDSSITEISLEFARELSLRFHCVIFTLT